MSENEGRVVLIAGATGSLGMAVARRFAGTGAHLALLDRAMGRLHDIYPEYAVDERHIFLECPNFEDAAHVAAGVRKLIDRFGRLDVFVTTVGGYVGGKSLLETPVETFDSLIDSNVRTFYVMAQGVLPPMLAKGSGKIIGVGARPGLVGARGAGAYSASKAALIRMVESLAGEVGPAGINVNCVIPGTLDTPANRAGAPGKPLVSLDSIAGVILFLASDLARDVHGASIPVYGLT